MIKIWHLLQITVVLLNQYYRDSRHKQTSSKVNFFTHSVSSRCYCKRLLSRGNIFPVLTYSVKTGNQLQTDFTYNWKLQCHHRTLKLNRQMRCRCLSKFVLCYQRLIHYKSLVDWGHSWKLPVWTKVQRQCLRDR